MTKSAESVSQETAIAGSTTLTYHEVFPEPSPYLYAVTTAQLDEHLRLISELCARANRRIAPVEVTFDDGHISNYRYALSVLAKNSRRAIFFITTEWTGVREDYMSWPQLRELVALGHSVQSHGWSHVPLTHLALREAEQELRRSKQALEDSLGAAVDSLSLPHGRSNRKVLELCARCGFRHVYTSNPWMKTEERYGVRLHGRLTLLQTTDARRLERLLTIGKMARATHELKNHAKELAQRVLGDRLYYRLWRWAVRFEDEPMGM